MSGDGRLFPWPAGSATGMGSMPGVDPAEAIKVVLGELPDLPYLPELPARGPGADIIGRTAALLVDIPVETTPGGWRLAARPGRELRRAAGMMSADLDALEAAAGGYGGSFKIQICGPWTLAAALELSRSIEPALTDPGATADLIASLAEGVAAHVAAVRARLPGATVLVQLDEPTLPGVLAGALPTASGLRRLAAVDESVAADTLRKILTAAAAPTLVHCCAPDVPFACITKSGAAAVALDLSLVKRPDLDAIGEVAESGLGIFAGAVRTDPARLDPSDAAGTGGAPGSRGSFGSDGAGGSNRSDGSRGSDSAGGSNRSGGAGGSRGSDGSGRSGRSGRSSESSDRGFGRGRGSGSRPVPVDAIRRPATDGPESVSAREAALETAWAVIELWRRIGLPDGRLTEQVIITPACGLAGLSPARAHAALTQCQGAARVLPELIEEGLR